MSVAALNWAFQQTTDQPVDKLILLTLADYADDECKAWPSRRKLADRGMCSTDTVDRAVKRLEALGMIEKDHRMHQRGGLSSSCYTLLIEQPLAANCGHPPTRTDAPTPSRKLRPPLAANCGHPSRMGAATLAAQDAATGTLTEPPKELKKETRLPVFGSDGVEVATIESGRIVLNPSMTAYWLPHFDGDATRLELALTQALPYLQENSRRSMTVQVAAQLAQSASRKRDSDKRYKAKAVEPEAKKLSPAWEALNRRLASNAKKAMEAAHG